ncbi:hypothetical protein AAZV13_08G273300 [Glycine max]
MTLSLKSEKMWLPLGDEILYSSSAKFWYTRMGLSLKLEEHGCCLYEMKFYISSLAKFRYIRMTLTLKLKKFGFLYEMISLFIIYKIGVYEPYIRMTLPL